MLEAGQEPVSHGVWSARPWDVAVDSVFGALDWVLPSNCRPAVSAHLAVFSGKWRLTPGPSPSGRGENDREFEALLALIPEKVSNYV